ncbi:GNAT family N-acetyltransferase [Paeniglutamicibacter sp.]|uniref:GNAT family N-acetyltransferase n=1 Tax=Paeniglutamicibacter sp. TaxID=1934391 RepID=UPI00398A3D41
MSGAEQQTARATEARPHTTTTLRDVLPWPVITERLELRPAAARDAEATWTYRQLPEVSRWVTTTWDDFASYRVSYDDPAHLRERLVVVEFDGYVVGEVVIRRQDAWSQTESKNAAMSAEAELGWSLNPAFSGRGLASEAVAAALRIGFEELGLHRVHARCFSANVRSWKLMERLGMRREAHLVAGALHRDGTWMDGYCYALLETEWQAQPTK